VEQLKGKSIVIVGGTSGIGLSAAKACLAEGASVLVTGKDPVKAGAAKEQLGQKALVRVTDATNETGADETIREAIAAFGRLDALYHVAGGSGRKFGDGPLHELTAEGWRKTMALNLDAIMLSNQAAIRYFLGSGHGGTILNMGSVLGTYPSPRFFSTHAYAAAKAAIIGFSRSVAAFYASNNIRVNVIAPALFDTPMAQRAMEDPEIQAFIRTKQPLDGGRAGLPEDADGAAVFLLSDQARFITGQVIYVDGGWSVSEGQYPSAI
jgi:NAD(P)-dependent dehydrogenase (short-subunit alcohol dehydrogenase family)